MKNNKKYSKTLISMILAVSMILALVPVFTAAIDDELSKYETVEEVPFTFTLEEGDLTFSELKDATLKAGDLPFAISAELAEERGHVNRLYEQETDDYTVMFQNRDGSKTIYLFSQKVKNLSISSTSTAALVSSGGEIVINKDNIIAKKLDASSDNRIMDYQIARCEISTLTQGRLSADGVDITSQAKALANGEASGEELRIECAEVSGIATASPLASQAPQASVMSLTYSTVAGEYALKNNGTNRYMTLHPSAGITTMPSIFVPLSKWLISYEYVNSTYIYTLTPLARQMQRLTYSDGRVSCTTAVAGATSQKWEIVIENNDDGSTFVYFLDYNLEYLLDPSFGSVDNSTVPLERCQWILTNHKTFVPLTSITQNYAFVHYDNLDSLEDIVSPYPQNASYYSWEYVDGNGNELYDIGFPYDEGLYEVFVVDAYSGITTASTNSVTDHGMYVSVGDLFSPITDNATYTIRPKADGAQYLSMQANLNADGVYQAGTNNIIFNEMELNPLKNYSEKWNTISKAFVIENTGSGHKITAALSTVQYLGVPDYFNTLTQREMKIYHNLITGTDDEWFNINFKLAILDNYTLTSPSQQNNTLNLAGNTVCTTSANSVGTSLSLCPVSVTENGVTTQYYAIIYSPSSTVCKALKYSYNASSDTVSVTTADFDPTDSTQLWIIDHLGVNAPLIKQTTRYWCGYTTALQILLAQGIEVEGDNIHEQTNNVVSAGMNVNVSSNYVTEASQLYLQDLFGYMSDGLLNYRRMDRTPSNPASFKEELMASLDRGSPVAIMVGNVGQPLMYSADSGSAHYICVMGYDAASDCFIISNCHYHGDVFGIYAVKYSELVDQVASDNIGMKIRHVYWNEPAN